MIDATERYDTIIVGAGQSGLAMGYELAELGQKFVLLEANQRVGDSWRNRWDSLQLFSPGRYNSLPGMRYPGPRGPATSKDDIADYFEAYASQLKLPVRTGVKVSRIARNGNGYLVETSDGPMYAHNVISATGAFHVPKFPAFSDQLDPRINQLHAGWYRNPSQLKPGHVLVVGGGNSGSDIALELAKTRHTYLAGRHPGNIPFRIDTGPGRYMVHLVRFLGHFLLNRGTPIGRTVVPKMQKNGTPVVRVKPQDLLDAGVERVGRVTEIRDGKPVLEDGRVLDVANVVWCTGFRQDFSMIDLPIFDGSRHPLHERGIVDGAPGLYFIGLEFQYGATSDLITGVGRDARFIAKHMAGSRRQPARETVHA